MISILSAAPTWRTPDTAAMFIATHTACVKLPLSGAERVGSLLLGLGVYNLLGKATSNRKPYGYGIETSSKPRSAECFKMGSLLLQSSAAVI